jgi:peroxiredoxin
MSPSAIGETGVTAPDVPAPLDVAAPPLAQPQTSAATSQGSARRTACRPAVDFLPSIKSPLEDCSFMTATQPNAVPPVGRPAPDFTLNSTSGDKITLSGLRGKPVLVAFFPLAFTSTCTAELCEMRDDHDQFANRGVTVLPISVDSVDSLKEYKAKYGMHTDLLSDFKREVSRRYGVLNEDRFFANRAYFLIDRDGVVRWAHVEEHPGLRRADSEILQQIDAMLQSAPSST